MELEADHVQTTFGEVCMNAIVLEASDTLWSFKEPCEKKRKKIGCKARLIAICYSSNPEEVVITMDSITVMYLVLQGIFSAFLCLQMPKKSSFSDCKKDTIQEAYVLLCVEHFVLTVKLQQAFHTGVTYS